MRRPAYDFSRLLGQRVDIDSRDGPKHGDLAIALNELSGNIETGKTGQCLNRHGPGKHVAADNDVLDTGLANFFQHRIERWQISVNVVECTRPARFTCPTPQSNCTAFACCTAGICRSFANTSSGTRPST